jgi:hypothetical protein
MPTSQGGGPGGYVAAIKAAQLGLKTACVEMRGRLGGTCLNVGCIPSKALLTSSHHYHDVLHNFASHGINAENVTIDVGRMQQSKSETVEGLTGGIEFLFKKNKVDYFVGKGSIPSPNVVAVAGNGPTAASSTELSTKNILIATGSDVSPLAPVPVDNSVGKIVDSTGALDISSVRTHARTADSLSLSFGYRIHSNIVGRPRLTDPSSPRDSLTFARVVSLPRFASFLGNAPKITAGPRDHGRGGGRGDRTRDGIGLEPAGDQGHCD